MDYRKIWFFVYEKSHKVCRLYSLLFQDRFPNAINISKINHTNVYASLAKAEREGNSDLDVT